MPEEPTSGERLLDAARAGDVVSLEALLAENPEYLEYRNQMGQGAVLLAQYHRKPEAVRFLLGRGPNLTLHEACATGVQARAEKVLQEVPRMIDSHSPDGFTPLALACFFGHLELAKWLVDRGANLNLPAKNQMMVAPIHAAVGGRHLEIVRALVEAGADVNARQHGGYTALHAAAQDGNEAMTTFLLEHGADRNARADNNQSALDFALLRGHAGVVALLER